jgi:hypothetical protein
MFKKTVKKYGYEKCMIEINGGLLLLLLFLVQYIFKAVFVGLLYLIRMAPIMIFLACCCFFEFFDTKIKSYYLHIVLYLGERNEITAIENKL